MPRTDLLGLTEDDLAKLTTRGKVKEARSDLDKGVTGELLEAEDGAIRVEWSDGRVCELGVQATLRAGRCSCAAVDPCKHLVRLVLLYQRLHEVPAAASEPWDPGAISDEELGRHYRPAALEKARQEFDAGILAELVRATRPVARFQVPGCCVRFLVLGDLRYTRCDCAKASPCEHVLLAVWAFRLLEAEKRAGIVTAGAATSAVPGELLDALEETATELACQGMSGASKGWTDRLARLATRCEQSELVWPGTLVRELHAQQEAYVNQDARFDPVQVVDVVGELLVRVDAIRRGTVPRLLVQGTREDRETKLGFSEFTGLGCGVRVERKRVVLSAYLHDGKSSGVLALTKAIADGAEETRSFAALGGHVALKGASFAQVGVGIVQVQSGRRTTGHELLPGRSSASVMVQERWNWEEIGPPVYVAAFAELEDRLSSLPPSALRPRRLVEDFHVLRVQEVRGAQFDSASHSVQALVADGCGREALLVHPYVTRGAAGAETLIARLQSKDELRFASGVVRREARGLVMQPVCLVWEQGGKRVALQPWVEGGGVSAKEVAAGEMGEGTGDAVGELLRQVQETLGEVCLLGLARADEPLAKRVRELVRQGEGVGFVRLAGHVAALAEVVEQKAHTLRWEMRAAAKVVLELAALMRLARDVW